MVNLAKYLKALARVAKTFEIHIGPLHARGAPAVLVGVSGVVIAAGIANALVRSVPMLPETLREANGLARTLRGEPQRLNP